jgi:23S rRNA (guanosine2251-2'-O)-methyltransferase
VPRGREPRSRAHDAGSTEPGGQRLVAGIQPVREAIRAHGSRLLRVALEDKSTPTLDGIARFAGDQGVAEVTRVRRGDLDRWTQGIPHQGAVAWAPPLSLIQFADLLALPDLLALALDGIQDTQNFGAVIRSAVAVAGAAIVWGEHASAPLSSATFRASAGAIEHARLCRVPALAGALVQARAAGVNVVGLDPRAEHRLADLPLQRPLIIVVGSEHEGMGRAVRRACSALGRVVLSGQVDSLNASVAAGIALYECANRQ